MRVDTASGLIYYLLDANRFEQRIKIGYTTNLALRLRDVACQTMARQEPLVLALEPGPMTLERERHAQFKSQRVLAEWFRYEGPLVEHIAALPSPIGWLTDNPPMWLFLGGWQRFPIWTAPYQWQEPDLDPLREPVEF